MRNRIRNIIILMSVCILGIYLFQGYWLYTSYQLRKDEFSKEINDALRTAVFNKQFNDVRRFIRFPHNDRDNDRRFERGVPKVMETVGGVVVGYASKSVRAERALPTRPPHPDSLGELTTVLARVDSSGKERVMLFRQQHGKADIETVTELSDTTVLRLSQSPDNRNLRVYADSMAQQISDFLILNNIYKDRFSVKKLDSIYTQELSNRDIATGYRIDTFQASFDSWSREGFRDSLRIRGPFQTSKINFNPLSNLFVQATFEAPVPYILKQMLWILVGSVALLLLTTTCFLYMMRTILKQKKLSEVKNDFINNMTHELKTPIATVYAAVEAMQNFNALNDQRKTTTYLDISKQELQRLSDLVEKVLHIAAEEKEDFDLFLEETDLNELVENIITNHRLKTAKPVSFHFDPLDEPVVNVDRTHLSNAISNLVDNAIKYSREKADITILLKSNGGRVVVSVKDQGIGIPKLYRENIFEKFFRVPTGNLHNVKGFGLGLSYVKKIVEKHEGIISVISEPDKGSEFIIDIPA
ncbi:HAMP domain-containing sensor histidine kinase [uncultured Chitinophaga sp.]|uniref:sensor histidine kinase n=1 Tax=uncultured Chitinophaga sp. TaxID=339340 RepID=UPI0025EECEE4|nr:HAMP domain-containing sensor histidine kinase [uncultured Chitinophaga sp.]